MTHVLIVDDAATIRMFHRHVLEEAGFTVDEAINGIEAMEKLTTKTYSLLVVDINMPLQDGYRFLEQVRGVQGLSIPALMISTQANPADLDKAWQAGANFYLTKPVKAAVLKEAAALLSGRVL